MVVLPACELAGLHALRSRASENALRRPPAVVDDRTLGADIQKEPARRIDVIERVDARRLDVQPPLDAAPLRKPFAQILLQLPTLVRRVASRQQKQFVSSALAAHAAAGVASVEDREVELELRCQRGEHAFQFTSVSVGNVRPISTHLHKHPFYSWFAT